MCGILGMSQGKVVGMFILRQFEVLGDLNQCLIILVILLNAM